MSNIQPAQGSPRVLFLGMQGDFSYPSLRALLGNSIEICAVVIPASQPSGLDLPPIQQREPPHVKHSLLPSLQTSILQLAWSHHIPVWEVQSISDSRVVSVLAAYQPDIICVACFPQRIPRTILDLPRLGCLNVHPSLLPANRGPVPLFWTFREGHEQTGVTIHLMDDAMDSGDILAQERINVPDGISYAELESQCALRGGELLARTVWDLYNGHTVRVSQDETKRSYHSFPSAQDFIIDVDEWNARHVYNFLSGLAQWGEPLTLDVAGKYISVQKALAYGNGEKNISPESSREVWIPCKAGWVKIQTS
jgi:methionyl-tRNA formyltransferase